MERIVILGRAGTGKTTLARQIADATGAKLICLDAIWQKGWSQKDLPTFRDLVTEAHSSEKWVSDGNYAAATFDIRLPRATLILWLEDSRWVCTWRTVIRSFRSNKADQRGSLWEVLSFIWKFDRINRPKIEANRISHGPDVPVLHLRGRREVSALLAQLTDEGGLPLT
jgi:adenylate kinase family enzyme